MQASFDSAGIYNSFFFFFIFVDKKKFEYLATRLLERKTLANKLKQETGLLAFHMVLTYVASIVTM